MTDPRYDEGQELPRVSPRDKPTDEGDTVDIADWRSKIDNLDEEIVALINRRAEAAREIGALKRQTGLPVYEPLREQQVFAHVRQVNAGPLADIEIQHVFERIIDVMRTLQQRPQTTQTK